MSNPAFDLLFDALPDPYVALDATLQIVAVNAAYLLATRTTREIIGQRLCDVVPDAPAETVAALAASLQRVLFRKHADTVALPDFVEARGGAASACQHWRACNTPVLGADGTLAYIMHGLEDVTDTVQIRLEGAETERRLRTLLATLPCMIYRSGAQAPWPMETISAACVTITGYRAEDFLSGLVTWASLVHPDDTLLRVESAPVGSGGAFTSAEYRIVHRDGCVRWVEDHHRTLLLADGVVVIEGVVYEVTNRRAIDDEIRSARLAAEAATSAKSAFLASMSHEIRTPMNAVIGMTSILLDSSLAAEQRDAAEVIRSSGEHLLTLINDILDYSKIEAGKIELERAPFSVRECIESGIDIVIGAALSKGVELGYLMHTGTPERASGDVGRLRQILVNLLSNAVKFTAPGGHVFVEVTARSIAADSAQAGSFRELEFSVKDDGVGISAEAQARLFQPFEQADVSTTRLHGGTGLGLSICRRLAELMDGRIWVESELGKGSTFRFSVRVLKVAGSGEFQMPFFAVPALRGSRVLIVDDLEVNRRILRHYIELWGMQAHETSSPSEALEWIERGEVFDIALLDYQMPEVDGLSLAVSMRKLRSARALPILILSSAASELPCVADVAGTMLKPIKPARLLEAIAKAITQSEPARSADVAKLHLPKRLAAEHPLRILVAEDNAMNQKLAKMLFGKMGYAPDFVSDGKQAVEAVLRQVYDVVFMDVLMPEMDGLQATRELLRRKPGADRPRIVGMSANAMAEDRRAAESAGMDDYVPKPVPVETLIAALRRCIRKPG